MNRVCLVGNSHIVCWKQAWDEWVGEKRSGCELTFFGASGKGMMDLKVAPGKLVPGNAMLKSSIEQTSNGLGCIEVDRFSHFVIVGMNLGFRRTLPIFRSNGIFRHSIFRPSVNLISRACLDQSVDSVLCAVPAMALRKKIQKLTDKPVYIASTPCLAEEAFPEEIFGTETMPEATVDTSVYMRDIYSIYEERIQNLAAISELTLLMQEYSTMACHGFTKSEYCRGGVGFGKASVSASDLKHMNKAYGTVCLNQMFGAIAGS